MATDPRATRRSRRGRDGPGRQRACAGAPHRAERRERRWPRLRLSALYLTGIGTVLPILVVPVGWPTVLAVVLLVAGAAAIATGVRARRRNQARAAALECASGAAAATAQAERRAGRAARDALLLGVIPG